MPKKVFSAEALWFSGEYDDYTKRTKGQQAAVRGNLTWLWNQASPGSDERMYVEQIRAKLGISAETKKGAEEVKPLPVRPAGKVDPRNLIAAPVPDAHNADKFGLDPVPTDLADLIALNPNPDHWSTYDAKEFASELWREECQPGQCMTVEIKDLWHWIAKNLGYARVEFVWINHPHARELQRLRDSTERTHVLLPDEIRQLYRDIESFLSDPELDANTLEAANNVYRYLCRIVPVCPKPAPPSEKMRELVAPIYSLRMVRDGTLRTDLPEQIKGVPEAASVLRSAVALMQVHLLNLDREHLVVVCLTTKNVINGISTVAVGSLNTAHVCMRDLFKVVLLNNAAAIIVGHNHPSGDPAPSADDVHVTRMIVEAGRLLGVDVLDHIVIGEDKWVSLKERGLGF